MIERRSAVPPGRHLRLVAAFGLVAAVTSGTSVRAQTAGTAPQGRPAAGTPAVTAAPPVAFAPPTGEELQTISENGRRIAAYHEAVTKTRAALAPQHPEVAEARAVVVDRNGVPHVFFFHRDETGPQPRWVLIADVVYQSRAGEVGATVFPDPAKAPPADAVTHLRAIEAARAGVVAKPGGPTGPWDEAVFKEKTGGAYMVYLQTQAAPNTARFGSDARLRISGDGMQVGEMTVLHVETTAVPVPARAGASPTLHSHPQGDLPTDTDVAMVVDHPTIAPHLILTPHHMFRIESDGRVSYLGPNAVPPAASGGGR
ncbi:MAG TPA: hypothetical protein VGS03_06580 [Candidatus Polarisedimenticolia bacterium]|jgi:hypothetical protein|nr:hypothetical protein [Candidatus Polarisedimenticolia bacterium]